MRDLVIVGAGIVGLAAAWQILQRRPGTRVTVLDKECGPARHQSGRNSGVIHAGVYYRPGSAKARLCRRGRELLLAFCREQGIAHQVCGKLIVAVDESEAARLDGLERRARANGLAGVEKLDRDGIAAREPAVQGMAALLVPETGIVDFAGVCARLAALVEEAGGEILYASPLTGIREKSGGVEVVAGGRGICARFLLNCAGLFSDRVARMAGLAPAARIVPFRGEYYRFRPGRDPVRGLVYPVPDPDLPFLGVHFTRDVHGVAEAGPNAVFALAREGYSWKDVSPRDMVEAVAWPGFRRMARRFWWAGAYETLRSFSKRLFVRSLRRMAPDIVADDLEPAPAGVRAQAVHADGSLAHDFIFARGGRSLHVINAPSPAATASLAIGEEVAGRVLAAVA